MSSDAFSALRDEYIHLLAGDGAIVTRVAAVKAAVDKCMEGIDRYEACAKSSDGVPTAWIAAVDYREDDCNPHDGLGQGDPWNRPSIHVPRGEGPFKDWATAANFYLGYDHITQAPQDGLPWSMPWGCYVGERWNGWGVRARGRRTSYLWGGTKAQQSGKFVKDGPDGWNPNVMDQQVGIIPIIFGIVARRPDLALRGISPTTVPVKNPPVGATPLGTEIDHTLWVQQSLNKLGYPDKLAEDDNYGRLTRRAVRWFQEAHKLAVDGVCGPETTEAIKEALGTAGATEPQA